MFTMRTSIHGRRLGLSSTGGLISAFTSTGGHNSSAYNMNAQMWGSGMIDTVSAVTSTIGNAGVTSLAVATATAIAFELEAPIAGIYKEIHIDTSASEISIGSPTTDVVFKASNGGAGSTMFMAAANLSGAVIALRGRSTARWAVIGSTAMTIG